MEGGAAGRKVGGMWGGWKTEERRAGREVAGWEQGYLSLNFISSAQALQLALEDQTTEG